MTGETDLAELLASLDVERRPGHFVFVTGDWSDLRPKAHAIIREREGETLVVTVADAESAGAPVEPEFAWLTLTVHSSLEAVGLTAAFSRALAAAGISCNVIAGYYHDHLLVPADRTDDAVAELSRLASPG